MFGVTGDIRRELIHSFRSLKPKNYMPPYLHRSMRFTKQSPYNEDIFEAPAWQMIRSVPKYVTNATVKSPQAGFVEHLAQVPYTSLSVSNNRKRSLTESQSTDSQIDKSDAHIQKKSHIKLTSSASGFSANDCIPLGCQWVTNSCAYDVAICMLYNLWKDAKAKTESSFDDINSLDFMSLKKGFMEVQNMTDLNELRDQLRITLRDADPVEFEAGAYASVSSIFNRLLTVNPESMLATYQCVNGHSTPLPSQPANQSLLFVGTNISTTSITSTQGVISNLRYGTRCLCVQCSEALELHEKIQVLPSILCLDISNVHTLQTLDSKISVTDSSDQTKIYNIRAIIYFGSAHWTARYIDHFKRIWTYDGMANNGSFKYEGMDTLEILGSSDVLLLQSRKASIVLYTMQI